jgi:hypothetical protein
MRRLICALAVAWVAASACSLHQGSSAATGARTSPVVSPLAHASGAFDAEAPMPPNFPSDFPIYPKARLTAGASFASSGQITWGMEWETLDGLNAIEDFYQRELSKGDWTIQVVDNAADHWTAAVGRKSDSSIQGALTVNADSGINRILLSLVYPG